MTLSTVRCDLGIRIVSLIMIISAKFMYVNVEHVGTSETFVFVKTLKWTHKPTLNTKQTTTTTRTSLLLRMRKMRQSVLVLTPKYAEY